MRLAVAALCVLALTGSAGADYVLKGQFRAPCSMLPPLEARKEPTVPYYVSVLPQATVQRRCTNGAKVHQPVTACITQKPDSNGQWPIFISSFLSKRDAACVLLYEKAHLPPNNWMDQAWEDQALKGTPYIKRQSVPVKR
jgi:hypothetical protein